MDTISDGVVDTSLFSQNMQKSMFLSTDLLTVNIINNSDQKILENCHVRTRTDAADWHLDQQLQRVNIE